MFVAHITKWKHKNVSIFALVQHSYCAEFWVSPIMTRTPWFPRSVSLRVPVKEGRWHCACWIFDTWTSPSVWLAWLHDLVKHAFNSISRPFIVLTRRYALLQGGEHDCDDLLSLFGAGTPRTSNLCRLPFNILLRRLSDFHLFAATNSLHIVSDGLLQPT